MEPDYNDIIQLERYLEKSLSEAEALKVEQRLAVEPGFRELYQNEKLLVEGIRYGHLKAQMEVLKSLEAGHTDAKPDEKSARVLGFGYWKMMAAAATLVISIGSYFLMNRSVSTEELYTEYFRTYPNIVGTIKRGKSDARSEAFAAYERKDWVAAAKSFTSMLRVKEEPGILLLLGNANLKLGKTEEALDNFITLSKDSGDLRRPAKWYMTLCYLKMGNRNAAQVLLEELAAENSSYQEKAKEMLKKMN